MIVDFCAYLGDWPAYDLNHRTADGLLSLMDRCGIGAACVSLAGAMFRYDARKANEQLAQAVESHRDRLWPIGVLDPTVPTWKEDFADGLGRLDMVGFRVHPNYHGYPLHAPAVLELAAQLSESGRPLFVALQVEEERFQQSAMRIPSVPFADIVELVRQTPRTTIVLNNLKVEHTLSLLDAGPPLDQVYLDINAMDMPFDGLRTLTEASGVRRLVFGSQMPFLYPEAALMLLAHSGLSPKEKEAILERNWQASPVLGCLASGHRVLAPAQEQNSDEQR